jgi:hypothetical protein
VCCLHCHTAAAMQTYYTLSNAPHTCCIAPRRCWLWFCNGTRSHSAALNAGNALRHQQPQICHPHSIQHSSTMPSLQLHTFLQLCLNQLHGIPCGMHAHSRHMPAKLTAFISCTHMYAPNQLSTVVPQPAALILTLTMLTCLPHPLHLLHTHVSHMCGTQLQVYDFGISKLKMRPHSHHMPAKCSGSPAHTRAAHNCRCATLASAR